MASHHTFWISGRARGVHQRPGIGQQDMLIGFASAASGKKVFVRAITRSARVNAEVDIAIRLDRQIHADVFDDADEFILDDEGRGFRVLDDILNLLAHQAKVDRQRYQARLGGSCEDFAPFDAVVTKDRDAIALGEAEADQGVGEPARLVIPLRESHRTLKVPGTDAIWQQPRMYREHLSEIQEILHVLLLSGLKIASSWSVQCNRPIEIQGMAAMTMVPISSASM